MKSELLRTTKPDDFLKSAISTASSSVAQLAEKLFGFDEFRDKSNTRTALSEATCATEDDVRALAAVVAPSIADSVVRAWQRLHSFSIALPDWTIGEPIVATNRAIWLRDLLRELARFELPTEQNDALLWLAIRCGSFVEKQNSEFAALMAELLGGARYNLGATGCDHVGRLLACELAQKDRDAENLLDTLRLVGTGRHPALAEDARCVPSPHVARALALSGREDALEILCETITVDRGDSELTLTAAVQATAAAVEAFSVFPRALPSVLEKIAGELNRGTIERDALAKQLGSVIALPAVILAQPTCDSILRSCASSLCDAVHRRQMIASNDDNELFLGLWAEAAIDIHGCASCLLARYEQACLDGREDIKLLLRTFARIREGRTLIMRPMWLRVLKESIGDASEQINAALVAEAMLFAAASGLNLDNKASIPADDAFELLIEIEKRLRNETLMAKLVEASPGKSPVEIHRMLVGLIMLNLAGRPGDALLPFIDRMDCNSVAVLVNAELSRTDVAMRKSILERCSIDTAHGPKLMVRAVAAAESTQELLDWLLEQRRLQRSGNAMFALACALRNDRLDLWRQLLFASKKDRRELGVDLVSVTLKVIDAAQRFSESEIVTTIAPDIVVDREAIRSDVSLVLDEYEAAQSAKKSGDNLKSHLFLTAREWSRSPNEIRVEANKKRLALERLCTQVADMTGFDRSHFVPTPPQPPCDRGSRCEDIFGKVAPKLLETAGRWVEELNSQSLSSEELESQLYARVESRGKDLREEDGSELLHARNWLWRLGDWRPFDEEVLSRANKLLTPDQSKRIAELRPPALRITKKEFLMRFFFRSLKCEVKYSYDDVLLTNLDWYESVLANLPKDIQALGPTAEYSAAPHPPHEQGISGVYLSVTEYLQWKKNDNQSVKEKVRQRFWPLLWWTASFGGRVESIDATAIGSAVSSGQASLADLVWYLVQPGYNQTAENLIRAVEYPDRLCLGFNAQRDQEILAVVDAVAAICRQQERAIDPLLPATLGETWREMPAPKNQNGLCDLLIKYADVHYQTVGRTDDKQKAFEARIKEALDNAEESWIVGKDYFAPKFVKFEVLDAWLKQTTCELRKLIEEKVVNDSVLLPIAFERPMLMRSVLDATGRSDQLEAAIWIAFHAGMNLKELAITLDSDTGHAFVRRPELSTQQIEQRLLGHYRVANAELSETLFRAPVEDATIRRGWKQAAIDSHPREKLEPLLKTLKAIASPTSRLRVEGLLGAMDGKLNSAAQRKALEASIKDRPNLELLQLAILPLPETHEALIAEISQRLKVFEAMSAEGRKRKSADAKEAVRRAIDQVRRTLADNAGLADPVQLDWLSGEAIAKELAEFERCEVDEYIIQLRLKGDGPHVLVSKAGKSLKSMPASFKSSELGERLIELQSRLRSSLRDVRSVLETSMIQQRRYSPDDLKMMMTHPVVASVARELVWVMNASTSNSTPSVGLPIADGGQLIDLDKVEKKVTQPVRIAHPLALDELGTLTAWKAFFTDHSPQAFQQVDRAIVRVEQLETAEEGRRIIRHDGVRITNEDQAFRILQAHGWRDERRCLGLSRTFICESNGEITANLFDFMCSSGSIGTLGFCGSDGSDLAIKEVPSIILSEAIRDIDRTVSGSQG